MDRPTFSKLSSRQRFFLSMLIEGAQGIRLYGNFEAYKETASRAMPTGAALSQAEFRGLVDAVPGLRLETNPDVTQAGVYAWLPSAHRLECADLLTQTMRSDHLRPHPSPEARACGADDGGVLCFERQRG